MAVAVESVATSAGASAATCVIPKPSGLAEGDLMIAQVYFRQNSPSNVTPPTDWVEEEEITTAAADRAMSVFSKIADADDVAATDFTFTLDAASVVSNMGGILRISGHDATTPVNASNHAVGDAATSVDAACGVTPSVADCLLVILHGTNNDTTSVSGYAIATDNPATWTEAWDVNTNAGGDCQIAAAYATRPETTATGNVSYTQASAIAWGTILLAIAPAAGGGGGGTILPQVVQHYYH